MAGSPLQEFAQAAFVPPRMRLLGAGIDRALFRP
jgi:hypothetical protein